MLTLVAHEVHCVCVCVVIAEESVASNILCVQMLE